MPEWQWPDGLTQRWTVLSMCTGQKVHMPAERVCMRKMREVLRLAYLGLSGRTIARSLTVSSFIVVDYLACAKVAGLRWPLLGGSRRRGAGEKALRPAPRPTPYTPGARLGGVHTTPIPRSYTLAIKLIDCASPALTPRS